jgi:hypothetical protein
MKGMKVQASISMMVILATSGEPKKALEHRLADHPADGDGRKHEGQEEGNAEELASPDLAVEKKRQAEGDGIFNQDRQRVPDHVAHGVPVERVVPHLHQVRHAVELAAVRAGKVPAGEGDHQAEDQGKDRKRNDEQRGRKDEEGALALFAAQDDLAPTHRNGPGAISIKRGSPSLKSEIRQSRRLQGLGQGDQKHEHASAPDQYTTDSPALVRDGVAGYDVKKITLAHASMLATPAARASSKIVWPNVRSP